MPYVPLREVRDNVANLKEFKGNNIFARKLGGASAPNWRPDKENTYG